MESAHFRFFEYFHTLFSDEYWITLIPIPPTNPYRFPSHITFKLLSFALPTPLHTVYTYVTSAEDINLLLFHVDFFNRSILCLSL